MISFEDSKYVLAEREFALQINVNYGDFQRPLKEFKRILNIISPEEIILAYVRVNKDVSFDGVVDGWNLHLYTCDARISFQDASAGYDGDSPRCKTFKILQMAGFDLTVEDVIHAKRDFFVVKSL